MPLRKLPILGRVDTRKRLLRSWQGLGRAMVLSRMRNHPRTHHRALACTQSQGRDASVHPISAWEGRALWKLLREAPTSPYVFMSERRAPLSAAGYQRMVARAGVAAKFTFPVHSHMLRHACGFKLANDGHHDTRTIQAYLGHRSIMSNTALTPNRFKNFWKD
jgi:integrase